MTDRQAGSCEWAEEALRVLARHYSVPTICIVMPTAGAVFLIFGKLGALGSGVTLGAAIESAVSRLTDTEIIAASKDML